ncbi:MAG TPA: hypothetical protein VGM50_18945, partial [Gemmatimonadaceae bacterium]
MIAESFTRYVALGDSASIDLYPALDAGEIDVAVALERSVEAGRVAALGAASLLYKNADDRWPEDMGSDLSSSNPSIVFQNVATDDATIGDVFGEQLPQVEEGNDPVLFTLTIGANDLLSAVRNRPKRALLEKIEQDIVEAYDFLVDMIRGKFANSTLIVSTLYDPSDRTGAVTGVSDELGAFPVANVD